MIRLAALALVASAAVLAGCAPAPDMPAPISQAEAKRQSAENSRSWWESMFPDEPMPVIEPIEYLEPGLEPQPQIADCMRAANIEGLTVAPNGAFSYSSTTLGIDEAVSRAYFTCSLQYPYDLSDPSKLGMLSDEQLAWIWRYNRERLVPCLQLLGYTVINQGGEYRKGSGSWWIPYYEMSPVPADDAEWARIDLRCPPSPVGPPPYYRPTRR